MKKVRIITPAYNEEINIEFFYNGVINYIKDYDYSILYVNDGSKDNTLNEIKKLKEKDNHVEYISFSKNRGKEAAMKAGLEYSRNIDMVIIMDTDLQHPAYLIEEMIKKHEEGYNVVYTRQRTRKGENITRRFFASVFYSIFNLLSETELEQATKDFMCLDKMVVDAFLNMKDNYRFTKGILSYVGFKRYCLEFDYVGREKGKTKWSFKKLLNYGISGLSQFSTIYKVFPVVYSILSFLSIVLFVLLKVFNIVNFNAFILGLVLSILSTILGVTLYFIFDLLYSIRRETINRPAYFIEESSL